MNISDEINKAKQLTRRTEALGIVLYSMATEDKQRAMLAAAIKVLQECASEDREYAALCDSEVEKGDVDNHGLTLDQQLDDPRHGQGGYH